TSSCLSSRPRLIPQVCTPNSRRRSMSDDSPSLGLPAPKPEAPRGAISQRASPRIPWHAFLRPQQRTGGARFKRFPPPLGRPRGGGGGRPGAEPHPPFLLPPP